MNKNINYDRWEDFSNLKNQSIIWRERNKIIGDIIIKDFIFSKIDYKPIILDIGCCDMFLEDYLKKNFFIFEYIPCDLFKRNERTFVIDLNKEIKYLPNSDYCIFSGVLEYLLDLEYVLKKPKNILKI